MSNKNIKTVEEFMSIQDLLYLCKSKWYWFLISLSVVVSIAVIYILKTSPVYTHKAELLIKVDAKGNSIEGGMDQTFVELGLKPKTNVNNEILSLKSPDNIYEVIKRLSLNVEYFTEGKFHQEVAYGRNLPYTVEFSNDSEEIACNFTLKCDREGNVTICDITQNIEGNTVTNKAIVKGKINTQIKTPIGNVKVLPNPNVSNTVSELYISKSPIYSFVNSYRGRLEVSLSEENASVITLSFKDVCQQRADDVLNTLISVYNEKWVKDINQIAISTSMFISDRLGVIERELGHVDQNISTFKSEHLVPDVQAASNMYMAKSSAINTEILALNNQLYMSKYIRNYLADNANKNQLLPVNSGIESGNIESQISAYNNQVLQRNALVASSSEKNPLVIDIDATLTSIRSAIIASIDNQIRTLNSQISSLQLSERQTTSKIAANPDQAKYLLSVERQQKVKEALYLFLLQKREENELSQAFTAYNTRIITQPHGEAGLTTPVKKNILLLAFAIGLLVPALIIFLKENMNSKVRGKKDLERLSIPVIGEIPQLEKNKIKKHKSINENSVVVKEGGKDIVNEAFRMLRTNMEFLSGKESKSNVFTVTSFNPGSGKSFLSVNIAMSLVIKNKKVLLIDGDMRHASLSAYIHRPKKGLSNYLAGQIDNYQDIIHEIDQHPNLHIIPVGTIPPNPTELLFKDLLGELIDKVKTSYDYIFIDCPPIEIVADTKIIEQHSDRTIFVVRAGLLERSMLSELQQMYEENQYKNMTLILNGSNVNKYGHYGYKYGYGYGYAHGYNYYSEK